MEKLKTGTVAVLTECAELERARLTHLSKWPYNSREDGDRIEAKINAITAALRDLEEKP